LDTNIIIHALNTASPEHTVVKKWLQSDEDVLATSHICVAEALRILTHPRLIPHPLKLIDALDLLRSFLDFFDVCVLGEEPTWIEALAELARDLPTLKGSEVHDARIALSLREHGVRKICTFDYEFSKYEFLRVSRPV
ncbi:MAG: PIN domain-containing protein, partial [Deltaproteobacteria bacterium]|nr:PIN domain-containing protein [Deltaproteobacteria bacterium]